MITVSFDNLINLHLSIEQSLLGKQYTKLIQENYLESFPVYRDRIKFDSEYLIDLAKQARDAFGWEWELPEYDLSVTPALHQDLTRLLGHTGFENVPTEYDDLLHNLHYCLHIVQNPNNVHTRIGKLQIEWFNDSGFPMPPDFEFQTKLNFGDCLLQNPYVGHGPVQIYLENDWLSLDQVCKFHTFVKPGIVIYTGQDYSISKGVILEKFRVHNPSFVLRHSESKILRYTGFPTIGRVTNRDDLQVLINDPNPVSLTSVEFTYE